MKSNQTISIKAAILLGLFCIVILLVLNIGAFWHREPTVFYEPLILPLETIKGDIIVLQDGSHLLIDEDKRINSMRHNNGSVTVNATLHRSLLYLIIRGIAND